MKQSDEDMHEPYEDAFDDDEWFDCGLMPNGQCMKAGSEECDWVCPHGALGQAKRGRERG